MNVPRRPDARYTALSVCVAAYNEEHTIGRLLEQLSQHEQPITEILICVNGCTDGTETVVAAWIERDGRIRLLHSPKGKPAAWNTLMRAAKNNIRLFMDADVELTSDFFPSLESALDRNPHASIVAARDVPKRRRPGTSARVAALASRPFGFDYVCGRAYAVRGSARSDLRPAAEAFAFADVELPLEILHEDLWLEVLAGRPNIIFASSCRVLYDAGSIEDLLRTRARLRVARKQVAEMLPREFRQWQDDSFRTSNLYSRLRARLGSFDGAVDVFLCTIGGAMRSILLSLRKPYVQRIEAQMRSQLVSQGGHAVLGGTGRLSKSEA